LFAATQINLHRRHSEPFFSKKNTHATRAGRRCAVVESHEGLPGHETISVGPISRLSRCASRFCIWVGLPSSRMRLRRGCCIPDGCRLAAVPILGSLGPSPDVACGLRHFLFGPREGRFVSAWAACRKSMTIPVPPIQVRSHRQRCHCNGVVRSLKK
jgi:hypothetical protein